MKLFILIVLHGMIAGVIGPLPYDNSECTIRVAKKLYDIQNDPVKKQIAEDQKLVLTCHYSDERPQLGERYGK